MSLTSACCVHSNVYGLENIPWIRYHTAVDSIHSTSSTVQVYYHLTSAPVEIPQVTFTRNSSSIWKEPVPKHKYIFNGIRISATSIKGSSAEQGMIPFTNVLQGHETVVLVCCTIEWEPHITCTWSEQTDISALILWKLVPYLEDVLEQTTSTHLWKV